MFGHIALAVRPRPRRRRRRPGADRARQRRREGQRDLAGRLALRRGRRAPRRRLLAVLHGHQHRRVRRPAADRPAPGERGLPLRASALAAVGMVARPRAVRDRPPPAARRRRRVVPQPAAARPSGSGTPARSSPPSWWSVSWWSSGGGPRATSPTGWSRVTVVASRRLLRGDPAQPAAVSAVERSRVWSFVPLFVANAVFWSLYQQQFTVVTIYSDERAGPRPVRLGDAGLVGAVDQPGLHHRAGAGVRGRVDPARAASAVDAGEVRRRHRADGRRVPAVPARARPATTPRPLLGARRDPAGLHPRRAVHLTGRAVAVDQARAGDGSTPRWWRCTSCRSRSARRCPAGWRGYYDSDDETGYFLVLGLVAIAVGRRAAGCCTKPIRKLMAGVH